LTLFDESVKLVALSGKSRGMEIHGFPGFADPKRNQPDFLQIRMY
jgi:hypothetical protein